MNVEMQHQDSVKEWSPEQIQEKYPLLLETRPDGSKWSGEELQEQCRVLDLIEKESEKTRKQNLSKRRVREKIEGLRQHIREQKKEYFLLRKEQKKKHLFLILERVTLFLRELKEELIRKARNDLQRIRHSLS
jgi:hypothetical protein